MLLACVAAKRQLPPTVDVVEMVHSNLPIQPSAEYASSKPLAGVPVRTDVMQWGETTASPTGGLITINNLRENWLGW